MKPYTAMIVGNIIYYIFLGATAYFVTPYILLMVLITQGYIVKSTKKKKRTTNDIYKQIKQYHLFSIAPLFTCDSIESRV